MSLNLFNCDGLFFQLGELIFKFEGLFSHCEGREVCVHQLFSVLTRYFTI